jgi:EthD domain
MIKMNVFLTRRPDLTHEQFTDYWTNAHTPLLAAMPASAENTRKYVQLHGTGDTIPGLASAPMLRFGNPTRLGVLQRGARPHHGRVLWDRS